MLVLSACAQGTLAVSPGTILDGVILAGRVINSGSSSSSSGSSRGSSGVRMPRETSITEVGFITHPSGSDTYYAPQIQRSLIIGSTLWTVSAGGLLASDATTLTRQAWVPFN